MNLKQLFLLPLLLSGNTLLAQEEIRSSGSLYLQPADKSDVCIPFRFSDEGHRFEPTWGLDMAWMSDQNIGKGINHMGRDNIGIGRSAFRFTEPLVNDSALTTSVITTLRTRTNAFNRVRQDLPVVLTADQEAGTCDYFVVNKSAKTDHWAAMINSHVHWIQANTKHPVVGVSPFNEPDYWSVEEGATPSKQKEVARLLKQNYPRMADIAIVGGNTLNDDKAMEWYNTGKEYYGWGNTHQLAGSFANYAGFFQQVTADGKTGYADEMHNVGEAMVGLEYGMTVGIWWGFDSRARGEFCDISRNGVRLAYGEHRNNWTAASVYRHDQGTVKAFVGSSERQASTTSYLFVSPERDVYYDGYGPVREMRSVILGGTGYQSGQTNAERVIDITWGPDVQPMQITEGVYKLINKATGNAAIVSGTNIAQARYSGIKTQQWTIKPATNRTGGDLSFYDIELVNNAKTRMNVTDFSLVDNGNVMAYSKNETPSTNEQWYFEYAANGYYYIRNRESALYLSSASTNVVQRKKLNEGENDVQLWRILPIDIAYETTPPAQPANLLAEANSASVRLTWDAVGDNDLDGYMILRGVAGDESSWNTIARRITTTYYVDNTCQQGIAYSYKVKAIDKAQNLSEPSEPVNATPTGEPSLIARWQFDGNTLDGTPNMMDAALKGSVLYPSDHKSGEKSIRLSSSCYIQLPYEIANSEELTIAMWVKWSTASNWQRIFDFGNDTEHYMFLTPSNSYSNVMRFAIKNGGDEQTLDCPTKLTTNQWKYIAVSIGRDKTTIFIDGEEAASTTGITIRPSDIRPVLNYFGRSQFNADPYFLGSIDDARIYNYALDADGVREAMEDKNVDGISLSSFTTYPSPSTIYDLSGRKLPTVKPGINIIDRKKVMK